MNLDDLRAEVSITSTTTEPEEEFDDDDPEVDLSNALSLLDDCQTIFDTLMKGKEQHKPISYYMYGEIERLALETTAFLLDFDINADTTKVDKPWEGDW